MALLGDNPATGKTRCPLAARHGGRWRAQRVIGKVRQHEVDPTPPKGLREINTASVISARGSTSSNSRSQPMIAGRRQCTRSSHTGLAIGKALIARPRSTVRSHRLPQRLTAAVERFGARNAADVQRAIVVYLNGAGGIEPVGQRWSILQIGRNRPDRNRIDLASAVLSAKAGDVRYARQ